MIERQRDRDTKEKTEKKIERYGDKRYIETTRQRYRKTMRYRLSYR